MLPLVILGGALYYLSRPRRNPDWITTNGVHRPIYGKGGTGGDGRAGDPTAYDDARLKEPPKTIRRSGSATTSGSAAENERPPTMWQRIILEENEQPFYLPVKPKGLQLSAKKVMDSNIRLAVQNLNLALSEQKRLDGYATKRAELLQAAATDTQRQAVINKQYRQAVATSRQIIAQSVEIATQYAKQAGAASLAELATAHGISVPSMIEVGVMPTRRARRR